MKLEIKKLQSLLQVEKLARSNGVRAAEQTRRDLKQLQQNRPTTTTSTTVSSSTIAASTIINLSTSKQECESEKKKIREMEKDIARLERKEKMRETKQREIDERKELVNTLHYVARQLACAQADSNHVSRQAARLESDIAKASSETQWMITSWSSAVENLDDALISLQSLQIGYKTTTPSRAGSLADSVADSIEAACESMVDTRRSLEVKRDRQAEEAASSSSSLKSNVTTLRLERSTMSERMKHEHAMTVERLMASTRSARERDEVALSTRYDEFLQQISGDMEKTLRLEAELSALRRTHEKDDLRRATLEKKIVELKAGRDQNLRLFTTTKLEKSEILDRLVESNREREEESLTTEKMLVQRRREEQKKYNDLLAKMKNDRADKFKKIKKYAVVSLKETSAGIMSAIEEEYVEVLSKMEKKVQEKESEIDCCMQGVLQQEANLKNYRLALQKIQEKGIQESNERNKVEVMKKLSMRQCKRRIHEMWKRGNVGIMEKLRFFETLAGNSGVMSSLSVLQLWSDEKKRIDAGKELEHLVPEWRRTIRLVLFMEHLVNHTHVHYDAASIMFDEMTSCGLAIPTVLVESHHPLFVGPKVSSNRSRVLSRYKEEMLSIEPQYDVLLRRKHSFEEEMMTLLLKYRIETGEDFLIVDGEHYVDTGSHAMMVPLEKVLTGLTFDDEGNDQTNVTMHAVTSPTARDSARRASAVVFEEKVGVQENQKDISTDGFVHAIGLVRLETDERFKIKAAVHGCLDTEKCLLRISKRFQK